MARILVAIFSDAHSNQILMHNYGITSVETSYPNIPYLITWLLAMQSWSVNYKLKSHHEHIKQLKKTFVFVSSTICTLKIMAEQLKKLVYKRYKEFTIYSHTPIYTSISSLFSRWYYIIYRVVFSLRLPCLALCYDNFLSQANIRLSVHASDFSAVMWLSG